MACPKCMNAHGLSFHEEGTELNPEHKWYCVVCDWTGNYLLGEEEEKEEKKDISAE